MPPPGKTSRKNKIDIPDLLDVANAVGADLDARERRALENARLVALGAAPEKRGKMSAKMGIGIKEKERRRAAAARDDAIAQGMYRYTRKADGKLTRVVSTAQTDRSKPNVYVTLDDIDHKRAIDMKKAARKFQSGQAWSSKEDSRNARSKQLSKGRKSKARSY